MKKAINVMPAMREWYEREIVAPHRNEKRERNKAYTAPAENRRTPATPEELAAIKAIGRVTYCPGTGTKRFANQIQGVTALTDPQRAYLWKIVWRFRRQIPDTSLVATALGKAKAGGAA